VIIAGALFFAFNWRYHGAIEGLREENARSQSRLNEYRANPPPGLAPITYVRSILRLRFSGHMEQPQEIEKENVSAWFCYWSHGGEVKDDQGRTLLSIPSSWALFIVFERQTKYNQLIATFSGARPHSYEPRLQLINCAVLTLTGMRNGD
jgi:hypothetical protein